MTAERARLAAEEAEAQANARAEPREAVVAQP
jgi:hypothetical protein